MANPSASRSSDPGRERLVVALVRGVHGLRGSLRVEVLTDQPEARFLPGAILYREGSADPLTVVAAEPVADGPGWRLRFRELAERTAAEALRGAYLEVAISAIDALPRGTYYWHEVLGAAVLDVDGNEVGRVHDIYRVAETEVLVVRSDRYGDFDVPVVRSLVRVFAPRRGEIVVDVAALDLRPARSQRPPRERPRRARRTAGPGDGAGGVVGSRVDDGAAGQASPGPESPGS